VLHKKITCTTPGSHIDQRLDYVLDIIYGREVLHTACHLSYKSSDNAGVSCIESSPYAYLVAKKTGSAAGMHNEHVLQRILAADTLRFVKQLRSIDRVSQDACRVR
jgi:hypothetical protein